ncbi:hypothetical protein GS3922_04355 [Geobacillus subterraneus]|uniref:Secreted protein n=2 Tax=Geobacillus TaxID=129337 RepID=A0ABN4NEG9_9BACL|nr:hypothetical protein GS3922_04355 [Geobacillus subterraneus]KZS27250.1 hypothetical protein A5418_16185 [Geobacillus subterraneus]OXB91073.1 hypothetical protein B9L21_04185 [Geobacillus uzenensis]
MASIFAYGLASIRLIPLLRLPIAHGFFSSVEPGSSRPRIANAAVSAVRADRSGVRFGVEWKLPVYLKWNLYIGGRNGW